MTDIDKPSEYETIEVVYLGKRSLNKDNEIADAYISLETFKKIAVGERELLDRMSSLFGGKTNRHLIIGATYDMKVKVDGDRITNIIVNSAKFKRKNHDDIRLAKWEVQHNIALTNRKAASLVAKLKKQSHIEDELKGLQHLYQKLAWNDRTAFELLVLNYIRGNIK